MTNGISMLIPGIPDDISLCCLARIPTLESGGLLLVSKAWMRAFSSGNVFKVRKQNEWTKKSLVVLEGAENERPRTSSTSQSSMVLPWQLYNPNEKAWTRLPPISISDGLQKFMFYKCVTSGPAVFVVGCTSGVPAPQASGQAFQRKIWFQRSFDGVWNEDDRFLEENEYLVDVSAVNGQLFVVSKKQQKHDLSSGEGKWELVIKKFEPSSLPSNPSIQLASFELPPGKIVSSVVKGEGIHFLFLDRNGASFSIIYDTAHQKWVHIPQLSNSGSMKKWNFNEVIGNNSFVVEKNILFGIWWSSSSQVLGRIAHLMRFDDASQKWIFLAQVPRVTDPTACVHGYNLEAVDGRLFIHEYGARRAGGPCRNSLHVLKFCEEGEFKDFGFVWEEIVGHPMPYRILSICRIEN